MSEHTINPVAYETFTNKANICKLHFEFVIWLTWNTHISITSHYSILNARHVIASLLTHFFGRKLDKYENRTNGFKAYSVLLLNVLKHKQNEKFVCAMAHQMFVVMHASVAIVQSWNAVLSLDAFMSVWRSLRRAQLVHLGWCSLRYFRSSALFLLKLY